MPDKRKDNGEDFRKVSPKGYVPALDLGNREVLTENVAVLSYIATRGGGIPTGIAHWRTLETTAFISTEPHKNFKPFSDRTAGDAARNKPEKFLAPVSH